MLPLIKEDKNFLLLLAMELSHIYLRTNAQNINLSDVLTIIKLKSMNFNASRVRDPAMHNTIKSIHFLPVSQEQEAKMVGYY